MSQEIICCRWAPSLGRLESTHEEIWGTKSYDPATDGELPCVFFGLYGLPDFYILWRHRGKKWILWAGTDITHFKNGYWLGQNEQEERLDSKSLAHWINRNCESWVENKVEAEALEKIGIRSQICPSFLGNINDFQPTFEPGNKLYTSVSGNNFELYGWNKIEKLAVENPDIQFHLYGTSSYIPVMGFQNVFIHGRVPKEQMNSETKDMQGGLRLTTFDGFSEILGKSLLWAQWPVSIIRYPYVLGLSKIRTAVGKRKPNIRGREYYLKTFNAYPWNVKK